MKERAIKNLSIGLKNLSDALRFRVRLSESQLRHSDL